MHRSANWSTASKRKFDAKLTETDCFKAKTMIFTPTASKICAGDDTVSCNDKQWTSCRNLSDLKFRTIQTPKNFWSPQYKVICTNQNQQNFNESIRWKTELICAGPTVSNLRKTWSSRQPGWESHCPAERWLHRWRWNSSVSEPAYGSCHQRRKTTLAHRTPKSRKPLSTLSMSKWSHCHGKCNVSKSQRPCPASRNLKLCWESKNWVEEGNILTNHTDKPYWIFSSHA